MWWKLVLNTLSKIKICCLSRPSTPWSLVHCGDIYLNFVSNIVTSNEYFGKNCQLKHELPVVAKVVQRIWEHQNHRSKTMHHIFHLREIFFRGLMLPGQSVTELFTSMQSRRNFNSQFYFVVRKLFDKTG